jgi:hypothetical protein
LIYYSKHDWYPFELQHHLPLIKFRIYLAPYIFHPKVQLHNQHWKSKTRTNTLCRILPKMPWNFCQRMGSSSNEKTNEDRLTSEYQSELSQKNSGDWCWNRSWPLPWNERIRGRLKPLRNIKKFKLSFKSIN